MSDAKRKGSQTFKKRAHRPWKTALLESTVQEATVSDGDDDLFSFDIDLDLGSTIDSSAFYPEFNFTDDSSLELGDEFDFDARIKTEDAKSKIKQAMHQTKEEHSQIIQQISSKRSKSSMSYGGFLLPQQISPATETTSGQKINSLLSDMKVREQQLSSLTSNLKISEAYERAEQAELSKRAASKQVEIAENRMRMAVEQATVAEQQFLTAMEQTKQAAQAHQEEARLRRDAENKAKDAQVRANNAEIELQNERLARIAAEEKAQHAYVLAEKASLFQRQLTETSEQLVRLESTKKADDTRRTEIEQKYDALTAEFFKLEQDHKLCTNSIQKLESTIQELNAKYKGSDQIIAEFNEQRDKLKAIIAAEQDLRKNADRKYNEAMARAQKSEQGWQSEIQQRKLIEERAKRAVANASRTVLHLLNTPSDGDMNFQSPNMQQAPSAPQAPIPMQAAEKTKIRVPALSSTVNEEFDYEDDDLMF